jgi:hypothetical protein
MSTQTPFPAIIRFRKSKSRTGILPVHGDGDSAAKSAKADWEVWITKRNPLRNIAILSSLARMKLSIWRCSQCEFDPMHFEALYYMARRHAGQREFSQSVSCLQKERISYR